MSEILSPGSLFFGFIIKSYPDKVLDMSLIESFITEVLSHLRTIKQQDGLYKVLNQITERLIVFLLPLNINNTILSVDIDSPNKHSRLQYNKYLIHKFLSSFCVIWKNDRIFKEFHDIDLFFFIHIKTLYNQKWNENEIYPYNSIFSLISETVAPSLYIAIKRCFKDKLNRKSNKIAIDIWFSFIFPFDFTYNYSKLIESHFPLYHDMFYLFLEQRAHFLTPVFTQKHTKKFLDSTLDILIDCKLVLNSFSKIMGVVNNYEGVLSIPNDTKTSKRTSSNFLGLYDCSDFLLGNPILLKEIQKLSAIHIWALNNLMKDDDSVISINLIISDIMKIFEVTFPMDYSEIDKVSIVFLNNKKGSIEKYDGMRTTPIIIGRGIEDEYARITKMRRDNGVIIRTSKILDSYIKRWHIYIIDKIECKTKRKFPDIIKNNPLSFEYIINNHEIVLSILFILLLGVLLARFKYLFIER
eukprot:GHVP01031555.1.p1 GENE.GHVP01031555.1~~GHVP01031555.1.p1  ORF type:complete len:530 (+),score=52.49 GHVP01031555.1:185-1591(+)